MRARRSPVLTVLLPGLVFAAMAASTVIGQEGGPDRTAASRGQVIFTTYCASCHGEQAMGDGTLAEYLNVKPANLTEIAKREGKFDPAMVQQIIDGRQKVRGHGGGEMPVWGDAFTKTLDRNTEQDVKQRIHDVTHFLWSIQK